MTDELVARALAYPFGIPRGSFLLDGGWAAPLSGEDPAAGGRRGILAFGANAAPAALAAKLGPRAADARVPVVAAELRDFDVVYSAHVSPYGAIPGALQYSPGAIAAVHVVHLLPAELAAVHRSEPNYLFARLRGLDLRLEDGTRQETIRAYVTRHGCLRRDGGHVGVAAIPVAERSWPQLDERGMLAAARDALAPGEGLEDFVAAQIHSAALAAERTAALKRDAAPFAWEEWEEAAAA
jgi:hypothetical protein